MTDEMETQLPALSDALSEHTDVTWGLLALIGAQVLSNVGSVMALGWTSPSSSLDYTHHRDDNIAQNIVRDYIAWTSGRKAKNPGAEERLRAYVTSSGWQRHQFAQMAESIMPAFTDNEVAS